MFTQDIQQFMASSWDEHKEVGLLRMQHQRMRNVEQWMNADPFPYQLEECLVVLQEDARLKPTHRQLETLYRIYPDAKAVLMDVDSLDTEGRELLMDSVANYLLGTTWPIGKDNVNMDEFYKRLHEAAALMDWEVVPS